MDQSFRLRGKFDAQLSETGNSSIFIFLKNIVKAFILIRCRIPDQVVKKSTIPHNYPNMLSISSSCIHSCMTMCNQSINNPSSSFLRTKISWLCSPAEFIEWFFFQKYNSLPFPVLDWIESSSMKILQDWMGSLMTSFSSEQVTKKMSIENRINRPRSFTLYVMDLRASEWL